MVSFKEMTKHHRRSNRISTEHLQNEFELSTHAVKQRTHKSQSFNKQVNIPKHSESYLLVLPKLGLVKALS
jgi:DNA uptake protein ComE-like DNA-binding protein